MKIEIKPEDLRHGMDSEQTLIREEDGLGCDGVVCSTAVNDDDGNPASRCGRHKHLVISGINPLASPRYYAIK